MMIDIFPWQHILDPVIFCAGILGRSDPSGLAWFGERGRNIYVRSGMAWVSHAGTIGFGFSFLVRVGGGRREGRKIKINESVPCHVRYYVNWWEEKTVQRKVGWKFWQKP
jgi:hypothetical protein